MDEIKSYIYLDEEAVNSIYAQLRKKIMARKTIKRIKGKAASFKIGAGLSRLFSIFSGVFLNLFGFHGDFRFDSCLVLSLSFSSTIGSLSKQTRHIEILSQ